MDHKQNECDTVLLQRRIEDMIANREIRRTPTFLPCGTAIPDVRKPFAHALVGGHNISRANPELQTLIDATYDKMTAELAVLAADEPFSREV